MDNPEDAAKTSLTKWIGVAREAGSKEIASIQEEIDSLSLERKTITQLRQKTDVELVELDETHTVKINALVAAYKTKRSALVEAMALSDLRVTSLENAIELRSLAQQKVKAEIDGMLQIKKSEGPIVNGEEFIDITAADGEPLLKPLWMPLEIWNNLSDRIQSYLGYKELPPR